MIRLEKGKSYVCRNGQITKVIEITGRDTIAILDKDGYYQSGEKSIGPYVATGRHSEEIGSISEWDLMEEYKEESEDMTPEYYGAKCKCGLKLDPYVVCDAYELQYSAHHHAVKKLLRAGKGHKSLEQDISEVIDTLNRWKEQLGDDNV